MRLFILEDRRGFLDDLIDTIEAIWFIEQKRQKVLVNHSLNIFSSSSVDAAIIEVEKENHWDYAIIDIMMPPETKIASRDAGSGLNTGIEFLKKCANLPRNPFDHVTIYSARDLTDGDFNGLHNKFYSLDKVSKSKEGHKDIGYRIVSYAIQSLQQVQDLGMNES